MYVVYIKYCDSGMPGRPVTPCSESPGHYYMSSLVVGSAADLVPLLIRFCSCWGNLFKKSPRLRFFKFVRNVRQVQYAL